MKHNILLEGAIGTGKTTSIKTILDHTDKEVFIIATEPGIEAILGSTDKSRCHWHYISPAKTDWDTLIRNAKQVNTLTTDVLQKTPGQNRHEYQQFLELLATCANFVDDRTGEEFGMVDDWDESRVLIIDGLSGLSDMARNLSVGPKIILSLPEWLIAQQVILTFIKKLCADCGSNFILISHIAREKDEVTGGTTITVSTLGKALAPEIIKPFDEIVYTYKDGNKFRWSTMEGDVELKSRKLPMGSELEPDFGQLFNGEEK